MARGGKKSPTNTKAVQTSLFQEQPSVEDSIERLRKVLLGVDISSRVNEVVVPRGSGTALGVAMTVVGGGNDGAHYDPKEYRQDKDYITLGPDNIRICTG